MSSAGESNLVPIHLATNKADATELSSCMLLVALDIDSRPTFILDCAQGQHDGHSPIAFSNTALKNLPNLNKTIQQLAHEVSAERWTSNIPDIGHGLVWETFTIESRWQVMSTSTRSTDIPPSPQRISQDASSDVASSPSSKGHVLGRASPSPKADQPKCIPQSSASLSIPTEYAHFVDTFDWSAMSLGPFETWPPRLQESFIMILLDPRPACLFWAPKWLLLYNEATIPIIGGKHPGGMGVPINETWPELWEEAHKPMFDSMRRTHQPSVTKNFHASFRTDGNFLEEHHFDWTCLPILDANHDLEGVYQSYSDVTRSNLEEKRTNLLSNMSIINTQPHKLDNIWDRMVEQIELSTEIVPQALLYSLSAKEEDASWSNCKLEGQVSCKPSIALEHFELHEHRHSMARLFRHAMTMDRPLYLSKRSDYGRSDLWLHVKDGDPFQELSELLASFLGDFLPNPSGDLCDSVVVFPIRAANSQKTRGFVIFGLPTRQVYDEAVQSFMILLQQTISTLIASALIWRKRHLMSKEAEVAQAELSAQLLRQTKETKAIEARFSRLAQIVPIGICIYRADGAMAYANKKWYSLTDFPEDADSSSPGWWASIVYPDDLAHAFSSFAALQIEHQQVHFEIRLAVASKQYTSEYTWVLVSAYPEMAEEDKLESIVACFTDITEQKWAADIERKRTEDIMEAERQQESFIDVTSHEIRNPLSVALQCAEEISSIARSKTESIAPHELTISLSLSEVQDILHASEIIEQCTIHQKRIVDDILTVSKMESGLLPFNTSPTQPLLVAKNALSLFGRELIYTGTEISLEVDDSFKEFVEADSLILDPVRLSQMLINLLTNAIKFTKTQAKRQIQLKIGASKSLQALAFWNLQFLPLSGAKIEQVGCDWDANDCVFLHFMVSDTGSGISAEDQETIFTRFSQGQSQTYMNHGGSGLGLFICRSLVEIHGGQIGLRSTIGEGSSFGFCIRTKRVQRSNSDPSSDAGEGHDHSPIKIASTAASLSKSSRVVLEPSSDIGRDDSRLHILIVEDNIINQKVLSKQLQKAGHVVKIANHGQHCLEVLLATHFCSPGGSEMSVVLMDIEMPVMNGIDCTKEIRSMEQQGKIIGHVPIVATTGNARNEKVDLIKAAGVDDVILKPFSVTNLLQVVRDITSEAGKDTIWP